MTQNLKIEVLTGDISIDGMVVTNLVTKEELSTAIVKKADLGTDGKIPTSQLPAEIVNTAGIVGEVKLQLETSIKDAVDESNAYAESYTDNALSSKADLTSGKVPLEQLPAIDQYPQFGTTLSNLSTSILTSVKQRTDQLEKSKADLGKDGKVLREQIPSYEKISGLPEQLEVMSTQTAAVSGELDEHKIQTADQIDTLKENIEANVQQLTNRQSHLMRTYATKELGMDAKVGVKPGEYFYVRSANEDEMMVEYQNVGGVPTPSGKSYLSALGVAQREKPASRIKDASGKTQQEFNDTLRNLKTDGAIGDGTLHTVGEWVESKKYSSLQHIQVKYPHVTSLNDSIDWAVTQKMINSFPYSNTSTLNPKSGCNGGIVRVPRGKYIFNKKITLKRGVVLRGESSESTQFWSLNIDGLIEYDDVGRYVSDELQIQDISLWQDPSVIPTSGAGIRIRSSGLVPEASVSPILRNLIIEGFYNNLDIGDCINLTMSNINQSKSVSHGGIIDNVTFSTSSLLSSCYAHSCGASGWLLKKMYYVSLQGMASDSNAAYGYELEYCRGVVLHGGAEANGNKALKLKNSHGTNLMLSAVNNVEGAADLDASFYTTWSCGMLTDNRAGSTKAAITGSNGANFLEITKGVDLEGSYTANRVVNINNYDDRALSTAIGSDGKNWQLGVNQALQKAAQFFFGGVTSETTQSGLDLQPNFSKSVSSFNKTLNIIFRAASADTFANAVGAYIGNGVISGGGAIARKIGQVIDKQSGGTSANAHLHLTDAGASLPVGNWSLMNNSADPSYFQKMKIGATPSTAPTWTSGSGVPVSSDPVGSMYTRIDGAAGATLYVKEPSGWVAK